MEYVKNSKFEGVLIGLLPKFGDDRGWFSETYDNKWKGLPTKFCKDNVSKSSPGTLRGFSNFQNPNPQGKLVTVLQGVVIDFIVDLRKDSKTFKEWCLYELSSRVSLYVQEGFAHGFYVIGEEDAIFQYKCTDIYNHEAEKCLNFFDPDIGIDYDFKQILASKKDLQGKRLKDFTDDELF